MRAETLRTRGLTFAYLFGPPRMVERAEGSAVHNRICDEFKLDDFSFRYTAAEPGLKDASRAFAVGMERQEGRGRFRLLLDHAGGVKPMRLLMEYQWPVSPNIDAKERFDMAAKAVFEALRGEWQKVVAEARIRAQCDAAGGDARTFLTEKFLNLQGERAAALGSPVTFASITLHAVPGSPTTDALADPVRETTVEVLREDPKSLYLEFMARWVQAPPGARAIDMALLRPIDQTPSAYIEAAHDNLSQCVAAFGR